MLQIGSTFFNSIGYEQVKKKLQNKMFYPHLYESPFNTLSPDGGMFNGNMLDYLDDEAYPFAVDIKTNKVVVGEAGDSHAHIGSSTTYNYEGRIWIDSEVIVFWNEQPDKNTLEKIIDELPGALRALYMGSKYVGDLKNFSIFPKKNEHNEPDDLRKKHIERWEERKIRKNKESGRYSDGGFGSSHPKYQTKEKEKRYMYAESYYPQLNEGPDYVTISKGKYLMWYDDGYPFGWDLKTQTFIIGPINTAHGDPEFNNAMPDWDYWPDSVDYLNERKYIGRIWPKEKIIAFWTAPFKEELQKMFKLFSKKLHKYNFSEKEYIYDLSGGESTQWEGAHYLIDSEQLLDFNNYPPHPIPGWIALEWAEIIYNKNIYSSRDLPKTLLDDWKKFNSVNKINVKKPYTLEIEHTVSPINKKKNVSTGFGSSHPKYQTKEKEKRYMYAESYYPKLK